MVKLKTEEGIPVHVELPKWLGPILFTLVVSAASVLAGLQVQIASHAERIADIEENKITAEEARALDTDFVPYREMDLIRNRLDRIESKVDRLLEGSGGE